MEEGIVFRGIKLSFDKSENEAIEIALKKAKKIGIQASKEDAHICKKSLDARKINDKPNFIYSVEIETSLALDTHLLEKADACRVKRDAVKPLYGKQRLEGRPIVVGLGPCGMFAALLLAENGYKPIVIERGADAFNRRKAVDRFYKTGVLEESNIQFGAGGAGTFSDGKLVTRINDSKCSYVLRRLHEFGAPEEILYNAKPHIGTDNLLAVVSAICDRIRELGGEILYNTRLDDVVIKNGRIEKIITSNRCEYPLSLLVLALGHSARDTYKMLFNRGVTVVPKPFSVGVRIEHLQKDVNQSLYGRYADDKRLPPGEYALSRREGNRAVYTFCMCPGGEVVAAASEDGQVVTNGMSNFARDGINANAAIAVSVLEDDFNNSPMEAIEFQQKLERAAFSLGQGGFCAPCETVGDYLDGKKSNLREPNVIRPTYMNSNTCTAPIDTVLPRFINDMLRLGLRDFSNKMHCFVDMNAMLTGVETRTSAPLRMLRNEYFKAFGIENLYPCGEGAGYAGGITSAAVDGVNTALAIMAQYAPLE